MTFLDTSAITDRRAEVVLATKFANERNPDGSRVGVNGRPEHVRAAADITLTDDDLKRLDEAAPVGATAGDRYPDMSPVHV